MLFMGVMREVDPANVHTFVEHFFKDILIAGGWSNGGNNFGV